MRRLQNNNLMLQKLFWKFLQRESQQKQKNSLGKISSVSGKGCGTREAIGVMRMLWERSLEHNNELYIRFVDFGKAFDRVKWTKLWHILKTIAIDWKDRRLIEQSVFAARSHYQSGKWLLQTSIHRQRAAAGLPTFTYTLSNLFRNDDDRCYGRDRGGNQGRRKASERRALRRWPRNLKEVYKSWWMDWTERQRNMTWTI